MIASELAAAPPVPDATPVTPAPGGAHAVDEGTFAEGELTSVARTGGRRTGVTALTCDLWYTLVYVTPTERRRLESARRAVWVDGLRRAGVAGGGAVELWAALRQWADAQDAVGLAPSVDAQVRWLANAVGCPISRDPIVAGLERVLQDAKVRLAPGAARALQILGENGYRIGLVSTVTEETSTGTRALLERLGLLERFGSVQLSSDLPWSKPHPGPFLQCLRELRCRPSSATHVGDLASDLLGAQRAGMRSIYYTGLHRWEFRDRPVPPAELAPGAPTYGSWMGLLRGLLGDSD